MYQCCKQPIEHAHRNQTDARSIHGQHTDKICHDDAPAPSRNLNRSHKEQKVFAEQHHIGFENIRNKSGLSSSGCWCRNGVLMWEGDAAGSDRPEMKKRLALRIRIG